MTATTWAAATAIATRVRREAYRIAATDGSIRVKRTLKAFCSARNIYIRL